jgi:hypothetical protein
MGVPKQQEAAAHHLQSEPISPACHCRTEARIRLAFWGETAAAEFYYLQPPVRDACREVSVLTKRVCRRTSGEACHAVCIMSRRHKFPGWLGRVADAGVGFVRVIGSKGTGNWQFYCPYGCVAFDGEGNLVVSDGEGSPFNPRA